MSVVVCVLYVTHLTMENTILKRSAMMSVASIEKHILKALVLARL